MKRKNLYHNQHSISLLNLPVKIGLIFFCFCCTFVVVTIYGAFYYASSSPAAEILHSLINNPSASLVSIIEGSIGENRHLLIDAANDIQRRVIIPKDGIGFIFDTSRHGEVSYLLKRLTNPRRRLRFQDLKIPKIIVDVGANDGFLSSNSYPLVQMGWSTVLIEPNPSMISLAERSQEEFIDPYNEQLQTSCYVKAGMTGGGKDTTMKLELSNDVVAMESTLRHGKLKKTDGYEEYENGLVHQGAATSGETLTVNVLTVQSVVKQCKSLQTLDESKRFGILSIDAEGVGDQVLYSWLSAKYQPEYIIYEAMHNKESAQKTKEILADKYGYRFMKKVGFDYMFEYTK
jgi:hypothetical protein